MRDSVGSVEAAAEPADIRETTIKRDAADKQLTR
jgi:hypothetical protein